MSPKPGATDWPELLQLLDDALQLDAAQRDAWLAARPERQQAQLRRLLEQRRAIEAQRFLERPAQLPSAPAAADGGARAGQRVGPWRLLHPIGQGGMAWVWLAERADGQGQRRVALKLPRVGWESGLAQRMARERDILATLEHPHIARLYDAGVDGQGRPWLALEHVQGQPIDVHCRERALDTAGRLALLLQVCEALAFAHGRLVIHRDIKPANVLVDGTGRVKLLDFGIARLLEVDAMDATALTALSGRPLTPAYASPEQLRGEPLGTASDIFALGVLAYELLREQRPWRLAHADAAALDAALDALWLAPPQREGLPAERRRALREGLDAVLAQALQRQPAQRYATVAALADDLRRASLGEPVRAARQTLAGAALRRLRRHSKALLAAAAALAIVAVLVGAGATAAVAVALAAGLAASAWQASRARAQAADLAAQRERADRVQAFLVSLLAEGGVGLRDAAARRALDVGTLLQEAAARLRTQDLLPPATHVPLLASVAAIQLSLEQHDEVLACCEAALRRCTQHAADPLALARVRELQGRALFASGRQGAAAQVLAQGLQALQGVAGADAGRQRLALLAWRLRACIETAQHPASEQACAELLAARGATPLPWQDDMLVLAALARHHRRANRDADCERCLREALALVPGGDPAAWSRDALDVRRLYAEFLMSRARWADALAQLDELILAVEQVAGPGHLLALQTAGMRGMVLSTLGHVDEAAAALAQTVERLRAVPGLQAERLRWRTQIMLGDLEINRGRADVAGQVLGALPEAAFEGSLADRAWSLLIRARWRSDAGRFDAALADLQAAEAAQLEMHGEGHIEVLNVRNRRLVVLLGAGRLAEARALLDELLGPGWPQAEPAPVGSPRWLLQLNRMQLAIDLQDPGPVAGLAERIWAQFDALPPAERTVYNELSLRLRMARLPMSAGHADARVPAHLQALDRLADTMEPTAALRATVHAAWAEWLLLCGDPAQAGARLDAAERVLATNTALGPQAARYPARLRERWRQASGRT